MSAYNEPDYEELNQEMENIDFEDLIDEELYEVDDSQYS
jgi:hypothetical protein